MKWPFAAYWVSAVVGIFSNLSKPSWLAYLLLPFLFSCASYRNGMQSYYNTVDSHQYDMAFSQLKKNKLLKKNRNKLLF